MSKSATVCAAGACLMAVACSPSIDTAAQKSVDGQLSALSANARAYSPQAEMTPLAPGQWLKYRAVDDKGRPSLVTNKIVGTAADAFVVEIVSESYFGRKSYQLTIVYDAKMVPLEIRAVRERNDDGEITDWNDMKLKMAGRVIEGFVPGVNVDQKQGTPEDVTVPAGQFSGSLQGTQTVSLGPFSRSAKVWVHSAVPLGGVIKSRWDNGASSELIDFGSEGATSEF